MSDYPRRMITLIGESVVGFTNAKDNEIILSQISEKGYNSSKMEEILGIHSKADQKFHEFEVKDGERIQAILDVDAKFAEEMNYYANDRKLTFHIFGSEKDRGIRSQLGIDMRLKRSLDGFLEQSQQFYETILNKKEILARVDEFLITADKVKERVNGLAALRVLDEILETKKGQAAIALRERNESYKELRIAWQKFKTVCLIVFENNQEHLKMLNIKPPAARTKTEKTSNSTTTTVKVEMPADME